MGEAVLILDDGELDDVAQVLSQENIPFVRLRGALIPSEIAPPLNLLVTTPRHAKAVRTWLTAQCRDRPATESHRHRRRLWSHASHVETNGIRPSRTSPHKSRDLASTGPARTVSDP